MSHKVLCFIAILAIALAFIIPNGSVWATATCYRTSCNGLDPNPKIGGVNVPTTCWNDKYKAAGGTTYTGGSGKMRNYNFYSPGCVANFSWTENANSPQVARWLGAQTQTGYQYNGDKKYKWVWNSMVDGLYTVCTKGYQGNSAYATYDISSPWACG